MKKLGEWLKAAVVCVGCLAWCATMTALAGGIIGLFVAAFRYVAGN